MPRRQARGCFYRSVLVGVGVFAAAVAGSTVAAAAFALPAALLGDPDHGQCKGNDQHDQGDDSTKCQHFLLPLFPGGVFLPPVYTILRRRATGGQKEKV